MGPSARGCAPKGLGCIAAVADVFFTRLECGHASLLGSARSMAIDAWRSSAREKAIALLEGLLQLGVGLKPLVWHVALDADSGHMLPAEASGTQLVSCRVQGMGVDLAPLALADKSFAKAATRTMGLNVCCWALANSLPQSNTLLLVDGACISVVS